MTTPNTLPSVTNFTFAPREDTQALYELQLDAYNTYQEAIGGLGENPDPQLHASLVNTYEEQIASGLKLEHLVGEKLFVVPSQYVLRALGEAKPGTIYPWQTVCGQIEIFRHYNGVIDPRIVLGPPAEENWLEYARQRCITGIVRLQLGQVIASHDPEETIRHYGLDTVKSDCGLPPRVPLAHPHLQRWTQDAFQAYVENWPLDDVLAIDEYSAERW